VSKNVEVVTHLVNGAQQDAISADLSRRPAGSTAHPDRQPGVIAAIGAHALAQGLPGGLLPIRPSEVDSGLRGCSPSPGCS
jgi:hypothetical protein